MDINIKTYTCKDYNKVSINSDAPAVKFDENTSLAPTGNINIFSDIYYDDDDGCLVIRKPYKIGEKFFGLGEKAFNILKNRGIYTMYNSDPNGYSRGKDPLYLSVPFLISTYDKSITGLFVNSAAKIRFDLGIKIYDKVEIRVYNKSCEIFIFNESNLETLYEKYSRLTGRTFLPPEWAIGHQISRYSYYPDNVALETVKEYKKYVDVSAIYLDIDYMQDFKIFTFNSERFPEPDKFLDELHRENVKLVTIIDPGIKLDQNYDVFTSGIGNYMENKNNEIYTSKLWPGNCAIPDFFKENAIKWWKSQIKNFIKKTDGIWLDMNEPSLFNDFKTIDGEALHNIDNKMLEHMYVHNAYAYYQVKATYEAIKEVKEEAFIVSRSGYAGIQKYAAIWTGDNKSSDDDLKLQISIVTSLNLSGIPMSGCDLGGFMGETSPPLIEKYYKMALLFPFYRNHSYKYSIDHELFNMPSINRDSIIKSVNLRYKLFDYIYSIIYEAHKLGHPAVRPMFYYDISDDDSYYINDQYILGTLLYAPMIYGAKRNVYLPPGDWLDVNNFILYKGRNYYETENDYPLYLKNNSIGIIGNKLIIFGDSTFTLFKGNKETNIIFNSKSLEISEKSNFDVYIYGITCKNVIIDGNPAEFKLEGKVLSFKLNHGAMVEFK
jgi:alpha-glucosidase